MSLMRKGVFALLATYVAMELLIRTSFVAGFVVGLGAGALVTYWLF
jgi:hypothetical protein